MCRAWLFTYWPQLEFPQLVVSIDLSIIIRPGVVDIDAALDPQGRAWEDLAEMHTDLWLQLVSELGSHLNSSSNSKLQEK